VTYKWLSYTLGVHVNQAKQMLFDYVERKRKESSGAQLHVTYLVAGDLLQNGHLCHKVAVVREDQLEALKSKLASLCSLHVYSIQRALLKDSAPLYNTDYDITKANLSCCSNSQGDLRPGQQGSVQLPPGALRPCWAAALPGTQQPGQGLALARGLLKASWGLCSVVLQVAAASSKALGKSSILSNFFGKAALNKLKGSSVPKEEKEVAKPSAPAAEPGPGSSSAGKRAEAAGSQQKESKSESNKAWDLEKEKEEEEEEEEEEEVPDLRKRKRKRIQQPLSGSSDEEDVQLPPTAEEEEEASSPPPAAALGAELQPAATEVRAEGWGRARLAGAVPSLPLPCALPWCPVTEKVYESESCSASEEEEQPCAPLAPAVPRAPALPPRREPKEERKSQKRAAAASSASRASRQPSIMGFLHRK
ncbi:DNA polymerase delta subunit 3, partial [Dryobates pubescens]